VRCVASWFIQNDRQTELYLPTWLIACWLLATDIHVNIYEYTKKKKKHEKEKKHEQEQMYTYTNRIKTIFLL